MRFNVPQFIDVEDKIIGPLSLKQFFLVLAAALLLIILWYFFKLWFVVVIGLPLAIAIVASIFIKVNGRPVSSLVAAWFNFSLNPKTYVWRKIDKK